MVDINKRYHVLIRGVLQFIKSKGLLLSYSAFTVDDTGILGDDFGHIQFVITHRNCFEGATLSRDEYVLPPSVKGPNGELLVKYQHLIYADIGPSENPYDVPYLNLSHDLLTKDDLKRLFADDLDDAATYEDFYKHIILQGISLVRFIQLGRAIAPKDDLTNGVLKRIEKELDTLGDHEIDRKREILLEACKFIWDDYNRFEYDPYPFISMLLDKDEAIQTLFFTRLGGLIAPNMSIPEADLDRLSGELVFFDKSPLLPEESVPHVFNIRCRNKPDKIATFELVAAIDVNGNMTTFDIANYYLLRITYHSSEPYEKTVNSHIPALEGLRLMIKDVLLLYKHSFDEKRLKRAKVACPS